MFIHKSEVLKNVNYWWLNVCIDSTLFPPKPWILNHDKSIFERTYSIPTVLRTMDVNSISSILYKSSPKGRSMNCVLKSEKTPWSDFTTFWHYYAQCPSYNICSKAQTRNNSFTFCSPKFRFLATFERPELTHLIKLFLQIKSPTSVKQLGPTELKFTSFCVVLNAHIQYCDLVLKYWTILMFIVQYRCT